MIRFNYDPVNINISTMQVGRKVRAQVGGESVMVLSMDEPVSYTILRRLQKVAGIYSARFVNLTAR